MKSEQTKTKLTNKTSCPTNQFYLKLNLNHQLIQVICDEQKQKTKREKSCQIFCEKQKLKQRRKKSRINHLMIIMIIIRYVFRIWFFVFSVFVLMNKQTPTIAPLFARFFCLLDIYSQNHK